MAERADLLSCPLFRMIPSLVQGLARGSVETQVAENLVNMAITGNPEFFAGKFFWQLNCKQFNDLFLNILDKIFRHPV